MAKTPVSWLDARLATPSVDRIGYFGMDAFIQKPIDAGNLLRKLDSKE